MKVYYYSEMRFSHTIPVDWNSDFAFNEEDLLLSLLQIHFSTDKNLSDVIALMLKYDKNEWPKIIEQLQQIGAYGRTLQTIC